MIQDKKILKEGVPNFFKQFIEMTELLRRNNHNNPEKYSLYTIMNLFKINRRITNGDLLIQHALERNMLNVINSDPKKIKENETNYDLLLKSLTE
jgi:hypothetical protein